MINSLLLLSLTLLIKRTFGFIQLPFAHRDIRYRVAATRNDIDDGEFERVRHQTRTLYDILGSSPTASRSELKQNYIKLARATHPDALIGVNITGSDDMMHFTQIAQAWKVLSDEKERRKYDRSLVAEDFKKNVAKVATNVVESAAPRVKRAFDEYAMPFLRRTTVTTVATVSAAVDVLGNGEALDLGSAVVTGMKAAKAAGKVIDSIEYLEKSRVLEERAALEAENLEKLRADINDVINKRLDIALVTPNSGLSSEDAMILLNRISTMNSTARAERLKTLRKSIEREIVDLEATEIDYFEKLADQSDAIERFKVTQVALKQAARDAKQAVQDELDARRALERAQKRVATTKQVVNELSKSFSKIQSLEEKATIEVETISDALRKRQEKVRMALRRKQLEIDNESRLRADKVDEEEVMDVEDDIAFMDAIEKLRREETTLLKENERIETTISKLLSRSNTLKLRAEQFDSLKVQG